MTDGASGTGSVGKTSSTDDAGPKKAIDPRRVLACGTCRKRKLKCDSKRPKCSTCARLGHPCEYDEIRKKSGPKRGYVKELEARLKQVENLLTTHQSDTQQDTAPQQQQQPLQPQRSFQAHSAGLDMFSTPSMSTNDTGVGGHDNSTNMLDPNLDMSDAYGMGGIEDFNWDMISLGLEEPLPDQDVMDELYQVYFEKVHPSLPMIHRPRFMASLNMSPNQRPPVCLRYIMWAHACSMISRYKSSAEQFYIKARKYIEQDEMKGHGEHFITVFHAQAWTLISTYEFKTMYFPRAWMSCGRGARIAQLMGLHRQDRIGLDVKQTMAPPKDWIEREERRRTFWMAYCQDRYASIGTGWPMAIDEQDILTNLPASEEAFLTGKAEPTPALSDVVAGDSASGLSSFAAVCLLATLFGRNLTHLHRPTDDDNDHDLNGGFWKRHREIDNVLLNTSLSLPAHLRLPYGLNDPNTIFANMNIHTSTICLHQAAIFKSDKHRLPVQISAESKRRCIVAADQITNVMKMCSHQDLSALNPFIAFCLYVAARVFVQYLKSKKEDLTVRSSLTFLLSAMMALRDKNPLTESFLVQLDVDLEGSGLNIPSPLGANRYINRPTGECPANTDAVKCTAIFELRETQSLGQQARGVQPILPDQFDSNIEFNMGHNFLSHHKMDATRVQSFSNSNSPNQPLEHSFGYVGNVKSPSGQSNGSHSNLPTPSGSSTSHRDSSHTSFSPPSDNNDSSQPFFPRQQSGLNANAVYVDSGFAQGILPVHRDTNNENNNQYNQNTQNLNNNDQNNFASVFGGAGFTPGPTGFTPGPSGFTPQPTGMTPGAWSDILAMGDDWQGQQQGQR
ncbi:hypothetical protein LTR64_006509 [Lithohypha guttulata]|uniref:uncharacterized protein n=1 Tax=Lithohypha guttulata TaxID=1690604 RepID=UPI002DDFFECD|nr:hypothetical protein LTR51_004933 [Lithohypha guttulata]